MKNKTLRPFWFLITLMGTLWAGCAHNFAPVAGKDTGEPVVRVFLTDFDSAWQAVLEALKHNRLDVTNREGGFIQTKWTDNTAERNLADSVGTTNPYLKAQYRFRVTAAKGSYNGKPSMRITVQREQLVQRDVLDGWKPVESDQIEENTLLYRIGRLISVRMQLAKIEEQKAADAIKSHPAESAPPTAPGQ